MASLDVRNNSAVMKRAEQLRRWEESDTNKQATTLRPERVSRIKFSTGCIFLAACLAGDRAEVLHLLEKGADINTANVDGLTALHQACIDDNLEMVEFLVEQGADINRQDNEGWTPLHATASCGFVSIARYLVENGANVAAVNSDGDLAVDLAVDIQHIPMIDFMQKTVAEQNIDCVQARQAEEVLMLNDAKKWLRSDASEINRPHPKTGATALHVAAAKGYKKVLSLLLAGRANVDAQDNDGWTPLHAAAHWNQKEAIEMLVDTMADMEIRNYAGQNCVEVADRKVVKYLEDLMANNKRLRRRPSSQISRISDKIENHVEETNPKIIRVEMRPDKDYSNASTSLLSTTKSTSMPALLKNSESEDTDSELTDSTESSHSTSLSTPEKENKSNDQSAVINVPYDAANAKEETARRRNMLIGPAANENSTKHQVLDSTGSNKSNTSNSAELSDSLIKRTHSYEDNDRKAKLPNSTTSSSSNAVLIPTTTTGTVNVDNTCNTISNNTHTPAATVYTVTTTTTTATSNNTTNTTSIITAVSNVSSNSIATPTPTPTTTTTTTTTTATAPATVNTTPLRRSFVPPVRDEESETQRKAHAKRVRETRRSTQGVTLDEIKSAEELVKKKSSSININNNNNSNNTSSSSDSNEGHIQSAKRNEAMSSKAQVLDKQSSIIDCISKQEQPSTEVEKDGEEIMASFTIMPPSSCKLRVSSLTPLNGDKEDNKIEDEVSATFIMAPRKESRTPTPTEFLETTIVVIPPPHERSKPSKLTTNDSEDEFINTKHHTPNENELSDSSPQHETCNMRINRKTPLQRSQFINDRLRAIFLNSAQTISQQKALASAATSNSLTSNKKPISDDECSETEKNAGNAIAFNSITGLGYNYTSRRSLDSLPLQFSTVPNRERESGGSDCSIIAGNSPHAAERRPSWRLKFDSGCKFKLEDCSKNSARTTHSSASITNTPFAASTMNLSQRRGNNANSASYQSLNTISRSASFAATTLTNSKSSSTSNINSTVPTNHANQSIAEDKNFASNTVANAGTSCKANVPTSMTTSSASDKLETNFVTSSANNLHSAATSSTNHDKENDKENDSRSALTTPAVVHRRRKPKRRSTGVVHIDMEDLDFDSANDADDKESGCEPQIASQEGSTVSPTHNYSSSYSTDDKKAREKSESSDNIDYKALWEVLTAENEKLKQQLRRKDEEVVYTKSTLEKYANTTSKNVLSELEKRERRAMERKLSELEEELKQLEIYKSENQRLKEENGALIRVISKLSK